MDDPSQYEAEIKTFINEETKSVEKGLIGLPSIGGFISKKKRHGQYHNPHIANNGGASLSHSSVGTRNFEKYANSSR